MLEVELVAKKGAVVCVPRGNLDATTVMTFRGAMALCVGGPGLIIDLSAVRFLDGAGLSAVVGAVREAQDQRTRVAVVVPAGRIRWVCDEAGLALVVSVWETVDLALAVILGDDSPAAGAHRPDRRDELVPGPGRVWG